MIVLRTIATVALLALGASSLVLDHVGRGLDTTIQHRRHAANSQAKGLRSLIPRTMAQRRELRQKRCVQRQPNTSSANPTSLAVATDEAVPQNFAPNPTPAAATPTTTQSPDQDNQPPPTDSGDSGNTGGGNTGSGSTGGGDSGSDNTGELTYYDVGLGACGGYNTDSDMICAVSMLLYDGFDGYTGANPNNNPVCGKQIAITYQGVTITVTAVDRCVGCAMYDLDLSPTAFSQLAPQSQGRLYGATWHFL